MPYQVVKIKFNNTNYYKLKRINDGTLVNKKFKSKESAINMAKNWMRYRKENPIVKGNKILNKK
tara:strand:- start:695 stop:886 length:192 start_codon:yes stop_codon:yes gene_type:complete